VNVAPVRVPRYLVVLLSFSIAMTAQNIASVSGIITDQTGKPVANAEISLKNVSTGQIADTQSDAQGKYLLSIGAPGQYEVSVSAEGFTAKITAVSPTGTQTQANIRRIRIDHGCALLHDRLLCNSRSANRGYADSGANQGT